MLLHLLPFALLSRAWVAAAPTQAMSTLPDNASDKMIGWVPPDAHRNTWGIIWSCLTIFIVCSWKCVHLNIPTHTEAIAGWHKIKLCPGMEIPYWPEQPLLWKWTRKLFWMVLIAVAPEYGVGMALAQYFQAKNDMKIANTYANGITEEDISDLARAVQGHAISQLELSTLAFIPCALTMYVLWWQKPFDIERRHTLLRLPEEMNNLPADFKFSIDDLLEIKPGNELSNMRRKDSGWKLFLDLILMKSWALNEPTDEESTENYIAERGGTTGGASRGSTESTAPTNPIATPPDGTANAKRLKTLFRAFLLPLVPSIVLYFTAVVFSAIHLVAWNWDFPSHLVRELWRWFALAALLTSLSPAVILGIVMLLDKGPLKTSPEWIDEIIAMVLAALAYAAFFFYTVARLVILGLTLYSLSSMPERAYEKVSWMAWIPHFS
ncbi:hypothetical protein F52700_6241 [Fusarium sp. NRRL 52700]|nr:hypothetical protein F52700_6241 [Fusarium sp. NRRL 52700]